MSPPLHPEVAQVGAIISDHLAQISELYKPGMKLTLVVRDPAFPDGSRNMVVSGDAIDDVVAALEIAKTQEHRG